MDPPAVPLTPEAAAFVRRHGGVLALRRTPRHGCCGGRVALAVAETAAPPEPGNFERHTHNGLTVFVGHDLSGPLRVGLDRLFGLETLYVGGTEVQM